MLQLVEKLNTIKVSFSQHLIEIPDMTVTAPNLEKLEEFEEKYEEFEDKIWRNTSIHSVIPHFTMNESINK